MPRVPEMARARASIIIPAYNEAGTIEWVLTELGRVLDDCEVIVVDDGSTDGTAEIAASCSDRIPGELRIITQPQNTGKGAAVRRGLSESVGEVVCIQDADLEYHPDDLPSLLEPVLDGRADVIYGTRFRGSGTMQMHRFTNMLANRFLSTMTNILFNTTISDMETGYKVFRGDLVRSFDLVSNDFRIEPELTARVLKTPEVVFWERPISYFARTGKQGKKIGLTDGLLAIWALLLFRLK